MRRATLRRHVAALALAVLLGMVWGLHLALTHHLAPLPALLDIAAYGMAGAGAVCWGRALWLFLHHY